MCPTCRSRYVSPNRSKAWPHRLRGRPLRRTVGRLAPMWAIAQQPDHGAGRISRRPKVQLADPERALLRLATTGATRVYCGKHREAGGTLGLVRE